MLDGRFEAVLADAAAGDERAFDTLYRDLHPPLLRYLRTHTTHVFIYYRYVLGAILAVMLVTGYVK